MTVAHVVAVDQPGLASVFQELARVASENGAVLVHHGANAGPREHAGGAVLALVAVFANEEALGGYLDDPAHVLAASRLGDATVTVIDLKGTRS